MLESLIVGGVDLTYEVESKMQYSFPNALPRADAVADEAVLGREVVDAYDLAPFTITLHSGALADSDAVAAWLSARKRLFSPLTAMTLTESGQTLTTYVHTAHVESPENHGVWGRLVVSGLRYDGWHLPLRACLDENGDAIDGTDHSGTGGNNYAAWPLGSPAKVRGAVGETYGRLQAKVVPAQASESIVLDCLPNPPADHAPTQDYQGTSDAAAKSGEAATATMTATFAAVGTAATFDTNANRGDKAVFARVKNNDATGPTSLKAVSSVSASGLAATSSYPGYEVRASQNNDGFELVPLGVLPVPAGPVPNITTGAGYGPDEAISASMIGTGLAAIQYVLSRTISLSAPFIAGAMNVRVKSAALAGRWVAVALIRNNVTAVATWYASVEDAVDGTVSLALVDDVTVEPIAPFVVPAGTYELRITTNAGVAVMQAYIDAGGKFCYELRGGLPLGFDSSVAVHAKNPNSSKTVSLDMVSILNADFCEQVYGPFAAGQGALIDNTPLAGDQQCAYITSATAGTAGPALNRRTFGGSLLAVPPGDSNFTPIADVPKDAAPTTCKLELAYIPTIINRVGGE